MSARTWKEDILYKFSQDNWGICSLIVVLGFFVIACMVWCGWGTVQWSEILHEQGYSPVSETYWFGTNFNGQDIFARCIYSTKTAFEVGFIVAFFSILFGVIFGTLAGFYNGGWVDRVVTWVFACLDAIPFYLLAASIAFTFRDATYGMHFAMIATLWTSTCKVMRAQVIKIKVLEYVEAAHALGLNDAYIVCKHIVPNTMPIIIVEFALAFVTAIKTEAVLSFLGLGVKDGVSWGIMLFEASSEIQAGKFNNFVAASLFMFTLVMAFNQLSDALQDAFDPKRVG